MVSCGLEHIISLSPLRLSAPLPQLGLWVLEPVANTCVHSLLNALCSEGPRGVLPLPHPCSTQDEHGIKA